MARVLSYTRDLIRVLFYCKGHLKYCFTRLNIFLNGMKGKSRARDSNFIS